MANHLKVSKVQSINDLHALGWFRKIEVGPGEAAQIDFGKGAPLVCEEGQRQRTHAIRVVLSHHGGFRLPLPSAIFSGIDRAARSH